MAIQLASESYTSSKAVTERLLKLKAALGDKAIRDEVLARHTSFRIGGPADLFIVATSLEELVKFVKLAIEHQVPYLILGGGSNVLVSDRGVRGLVIENRSHSFTTNFVATSIAAERNSLTECLVHVDSGVSLTSLAQYTSRLGLTGLEWAIGIPGTVGGAIVNNAGAFGGCMADLVEEVTLLRQNLTTEIWDNAKLGFAYRTSRLKGATGDVVLRARLRLRREAVAQIQARVAQYQSERRTRQPHEPRAGSVFTNPPGDYAGRLIEQAGLKGAKIGDAEVSTKHANFIINRGHATASDVYTLIRLIQDRVKRLFGITLTLEIQLVGDWPLTDSPGGI